MPVGIYIGSIYLLSFLSSPVLSQSPLLSCVSFQNKRAPQQGGKDTGVAVKSVSSSSSSASSLSFARPVLPCYAGEESFCFTASRDLERRDTVGKEKKETN